MKKVVATGKTSLSNNTEMHVGPTPPLYPVEGQLWLNTSVQPPVLYKWDGEKWVLQEMDVEKLDPEFLEEIQADFDAISAEIQEINEAAEQLKAAVEARNKQDDQYFSDMRQTIINNRYEALGWYEENDGRISGIAQSVDGITTRVGKAETNISTITQTANGLQSTVTSIANGTHSVITQMSDRINLRVEKGNIVSQINASAEGLYLAGKLIYLDGNVKVDGTFTAPKVISANSDGSEYTKIENRTLVSRGYFSATWRGGYYSGTHELTANVGYLKMQQISGSYPGSQPALYYTAKGISTYQNGNDSASGSIEFYAPSYSASVRGLLLASSGNIMLESTTSAHIFINPNGGKLHVCDKYMSTYYDVVCGTIDAGTLKAGQFYTNLTNLNSSDGSIKIGGTTGNINIQGTMTCSKVVETSRRELKKNIELYTDNATELICTGTVRTYQYGDDVEGVDLPYVGLIVDEAPVEVVDTRGEGVLVAQGVWIAWKAIQELNARIKELEGTS